MRKIVKYGIVALASVALLAGCSGGDDSKGEQSTDKDGTKVFSAFFAVPGTEVPDDSRLNKAMAELTGARADVTWLTGQTAKERIGVMVSGGDYPDLVDASEGRSAMIDAGAFVPIEDYLDDYPNLKALYSEENWERIKADNDGHIYTIPQFNSVKEENMDPTAVGQAFWIQKRVLKWANYPKLTTVSEYFDLINAYLAENPETDGKKNIGFSILSDDWRYFCLENPPQFLAGYPNDGAAIIDTDTLEAKIYDDIPEAKEYYQILSEQYEKGVIDPETFTMKYDQYIAKISSGSVLGMVDQDWQFQSAVDSLKSQDKDDLTYVPFGLTLDANVEQRYRVNMVNSAPNTQGGVGITINCKDVEGALEFLDSIVSEEATILRNWGEKGVDYEIDDDGQFYRTDEQRANWRNTDYSAKNGLAYGYLPQYTGMLPDGINTVIPAQQPEEFYASLTDIDREVLDAYGYEKWTDFVPEAEFDYPWFPIYTARNSWSSQDPAGIANQNMQEVKMQWLPKIVMNGPSNYEANWDDYMTDYKSRIDYKAFEEALTKEVKRRVEVDKELKEKLAETDSPGEESESSSN